MATVSSVRLDAQREVLVIDDHPIGGTKSRGLAAYLQTFIDEGYREFVYAGPTGGAGFMTLATIASGMGMSTTLFLCGPGNERVFATSKLPRTRVLDFYPNLTKATTKAEAHVSARPRAKLIPFGIADPRYQDLMVASIETDLGRLPTPKRVWLAVGSGCVLGALMRVWPTAKYVAVEVGKFLPGLYEPPGETWRSDHLHIPRATLGRGSPPTVVAYHHYLPFNQPARILPPYECVVNYDAKVWEWVLEHAEDGDWVWSVY